MPFTTGSSSGAGYLHASYPVHASVASRSNDDWYRWCAPMGIEPYSHNIVEPGHVFGVARKTAVEI